MLNQIYNEDCLEIFIRLPDGSMFEVKRYSVKEMLREMAEAWYSFMGAIYILGRASLGAIISIIILVALAAGAIHYKRGDKDNPMKAVLEWSLIILWYGFLGILLFVAAALIYRWLF